jgi:hypothetical protein
VKTDIKARYDLTEEEFKETIARIQASRELNGIVGGDRSLTHLTDEKLLWFFEQWRPCTQQQNRGAASLPFVSQKSQKSCRRVPR